MFASITIMGWLRHDPQFITTKQGTMVCRFQVGVLKSNSPEMLHTYFKIYCPLSPQYYFIKDADLRAGDTVLVSGQFEYKGLYNGYPNLNIYLHEIQPVWTKKMKTELESNKKYIPEIMDNQEVKVNNKREVDMENYDVWGGK